jgi:hypothetical protein
MRFEIGREVRSRLAETLGTGAMLTDELILFASLPTCTPRQLDTLARGVDALHAPADLERDDERVRGRTAEVVRRVRAGAREFYKLDIVESKLRDAGESARTSLPDISSTVADVIGRHAGALPARTLLFVFGDHGFTFDAHGCATQGGASPEEVLVPAFAFLFGDVH